jgi:hypothetical protein
VDLVVVIAGVVGLAVAAYAFVSLTRDAVRGGGWAWLAAAVAVAVAVVLLLLAFGDSLLR